MKLLLVLVLLLQGCAPKALPNTFLPSFIGPITPFEPEIPLPKEEFSIPFRPPFCMWKMFFGDSPRCLKA